MNFRKWVACLLICAAMLGLAACKANNAAPVEEGEKLTVYLLSETICGNSKTVYSYDANGNIVQQIDYWGEAIDWHIEYTIDNTGNRVSAVAGDGTGDEYLYEYQYDSAGNMLEEIVYLDSIMVAYTSYTYDENGNKILAESSGIRTEYAYNDQGVLILEVEFREDEESARLEYEYNENGTLKKITRKAGIASSYTTDFIYDESGCLQKSVTNWGGGTTEYLYLYKSVQLSLERAKKLQSELSPIQVIIVQ